jgi:hypothetical protein
VKCSRFVPSPSPGRQCEERDFRKRSEKQVPAGIHGRRERPDARIHQISLGRNSHAEALVVFANDRGKNGLQPMDRRREELIVRLRQHQCSEPLTADCFGMCSRGEEGCLE